MDIFEQIKKISALLNELDSYEKAIPEVQRKIDLKISDLYHKLEDMNLTSGKCYRYCRELKAILKERRIFKNNVYLLNVYRENKLKLNNGLENRQFLLSKIGKEQKQISKKYNYRIYSENELNEKIGI